MSFADIVAWSRNVGVSQAAFRLGKTTAAASAVLYQTWARLRHRPEDGHRPRRRGGGDCPRSGQDILGEDRPGQRLVRPGRGRHADPDHARLFGDGQRRDAGDAARDPSQHSHRRCRDRDAGNPGQPRGQPECRQQPDRAHGTRRDVGPVVRRSNLHSRLLRRRQDRNGPDLGPDDGRRQGRLDGGHLQLQLLRLGRAQQARPDDRRRDLRRHPDADQAGRPRHARPVVRAVPPHRDGRRHVRADTAQSRRSTTARAQESRHRRGDGRVPHRTPPAVRHWDGDRRPPTRVSARRGATQPDGGRDRRRDRRPADAFLRPRQSAARPSIRARSGPATCSSRSPAIAPTAIGSCQMPSPRVPLRCWWPTRRQRRRPSRRLRPLLRYGRPD